MRGPQPSDALRLLCDCAAWAWAPGRSTEIRARAERIGDWHAFVTFTVRHRLQGFANDALAAAGAALPPSAAAALGSAAKDVARANLLALQETKRLTQAFTAARIDVLDLKGLPLAILVYGECMRRHGKDIDLLVQPADFPRAAALIESLGYARKIPGADVSGPVFALWMRNRKDVSYRKDGQEIELHWRLANNPLLLEWPWRPANWQTVDIGYGIRVRTAARGDLFAYLCAHGAMGAWYRLKWVADVAGLLARESADGIAQLYAHAERLGVERPAGQVLLLCEDLFDTALPANLAKRLHADPIVRFLARMAIGRLNGAEIAAPNTAAFDTLWAAPARLLLRKGLRYKLKEIAISLADPEPLTHMPIAEKVIFLYPILRPLVWFGAQLRRRGRRTQVAEERTRRG